jgi:hypothetical protein
MIKEIEWGVSGRPPARARLKNPPVAGHSVDRARRKYGMLVERRREKGMTAIIAGKLLLPVGWNHQKPE